MNRRNELEFRIVGSCLVDRNHLAFVQAYLSAKNFGHEGVQAIWRMLEANPWIELPALNEAVLPLRKGNTLLRREYHKLFLMATASNQLTVDCLQLLELCFRDEAIRILKTNREKVLIPLAPLEQDIANQSHETWSIITAAANYCSDAGLAEIAAELSVLLGQMGKKASSLKCTGQITYLTGALKTFADQNPLLLKPFYNTLKDIADAAA